jgi:hypothetical protein
MLQAVTTNMPVDLIIELIKVDSHASDHHD